MTECSVAGCPQQHYARTWCYNHYMQWFRTGRIRWIRRPSLSERFWAQVDKSGTCWLWRGAYFATGYGQIKVDGTTQTAHRIAWRLTYGTEPIGSLHHLCYTKGCVRPEHLEDVDTKTHAQRHISHGNASGNCLKTHCPQGHPYDEINTYRDSKGSRHCRTCMKENKRRRRERTRNSAGHTG